MRAICLFSRGCLSVKSHIGQVVLSMLVIYSNKPGDIRNFSLFSSSLKNGEPRDVFLVEISASQVRLKSFLRYRKLRLFQEVLDPWSVGFTPAAAMVRPRKSISDASE